MLHRQRLLDIVENFILFDASEGTTHKIVARNHQYLGVNRVIERLQSADASIRAEVAAGQLGVFWHTQGSGKSYSMVFLDREDPPQDIGVVVVRDHHRSHRTGRPDRLDLHQLWARQQQDRSGEERRGAAPDAARPEPPLCVRADPEIPRTGD